MDKTGVLKSTLVVSHSCAMWISAQSRLRWNVGIPRLSLINPFSIVQTKVREAVPYKDAVLSNCKSFKLDTAMHKSDLPVLIQGV